MTLLSIIVEQARAQTLPEVIAVVAAIAYLVLAIRQNILCWLFAAISTSVYIWIFFAAKLYMESLLNVFYLAMAAYGWYVWQTGRAEGSEKPVVVWSIRIHLIAIFSIAALGIATGLLLRSNTDAAFPVLDSLTTGFAIWATFLVARKVLENWWYWLAIDLVSILIYWSRDLQLSSFLFLIYVIMIPFGLLSWTRSMRSQDIPVDDRPE